MILDDSTILKLQKAPKFFSKFEKTNENNKKLFLELIKLADEKGITNKATNIPDFRLTRPDGINFVLITFSPSAVRIHLQRNKIYIHSGIFEFRHLKEGRYNGNDWIELMITNEEELTECFKLINTIYENC